MYQQPSAVVAAIDALSERKRNRDPYDPQKKREHQIGKGPTMPRRVLQRTIRNARPVIIHQDHRRDDTAPKDVQRLQTLSLYEDRDVDGLQTRTLHWDSITLIMSAGMPESYDALLVLSFGGPEKNDDVIPFLENVLRGRNVPRERMLEVAEHYYHFGGRSPINDQNRALIEAVRHLLDREGPRLPIYWGNRNWRPYLADSLRQMRADGIRRAAGFVTSAYGSYSGCRQYREDIARARAEIGEGAPDIAKLPSFHSHLGFIAANVDRLQSALAEFSKPPHVAFTAHSVPVSMAEASPYVTQLNKTANAIAAQLNLTDWRLVYQSRSGPPAQLWLEPDIADNIRALHAAGRRELVIAPIGFVSDHMEVLYDLDTEAAELCKQLGIRMVRAGTAGTHPEFVRMVRDLLLGPAQICATDCCPAPQRTTAFVPPAPVIVRSGD